MTEISLKYGCNPNQKPAKIYMPNKNKLPLKILNGNPSYINILDALNGWQLVSEIEKAVNLPAAASFKHVSPAGAAIGNSIDEKFKKICCLENLNLTSGIAIAYAKARAADRISSYGDFVALSEKCDEQTALFLKKEVSDGIIAPGYYEKALEILKSKKNGNYIIIEIDSTYTPAEIEIREIFGIVLEQKRNNASITKNSFGNIVTKNKNISEASLIDLILATTVAKYTQSNSVCYAKNGMTIGIGAGQQSRIHCTKLAGKKADSFMLRQHPKLLNFQFLNNIKRTQKDNIIDAYINEDYFNFLKNHNIEKIFAKKPEPLTDAEKKEWISKQKQIALASDAFFPFIDNIIEAKKHQVKYICQPSGAMREKEIIKVCNELDICMILTDMRLFHH